MNKKFKLLMTKYEMILIAINNLKSFIDLETESNEVHVKFKNISKDLKGLIKNIRKNLKVKK